MYETGVQGTGLKQRELCGSHPCRSRRQQHETRQWHEGVEMRHGQGWTPPGTRSARSSAFLSLLHSVQCSGRWTSLFHFWLLSSNGGMWGPGRHKKRVAENFCSELSPCKVLVLQRPCFSTKEQSYSQIIPILQLQPVTSSSSGFLLLPLQVARASCFY